MAKFWMWDISKDGFGLYLRWAEWSNHGMTGTGGIGTDLGFCYEELLGGATPFLTNMCRAGNHGVCPWNDVNVIFNQRELVRAPIACKCECHAEHQVDRDRRGQVASS